MQYSLILNFEFYLCILTKNELNKYHNDARAWEVSSGSSGWWMLVIIWFSPVCTCFAHYFINISFIIFVEAAFSHSWLYRVGRIVMVKVWRSWLWFCLYVSFISNYPGSVIGSGRKVWSALWVCYLWWVRVSLIFISPPWL